MFLCEPRLLEAFESLLIGGSRRFVPALNGIVPDSHFDEDLLVQLVLVLLLLQERVRSNLVLVELFAC